MKILFLLSRFPYPLKTGDRLRAFHQMKFLSKRHEIFLFTFSEGPVPEESLDEVSRYCSNVEIFPISYLSKAVNVFRAFTKGDPLQTGYFYNAEAQKQILGMIRKHEPDHIFAQLIRTTEYVKQISDIPKTLDYVDALSLSYERKSEHTRKILKPVFQFECNRLKEYEIKVFDRFDNCIIIAEKDREVIAHPENHRMMVLANGVDADFFNPGLVTARVPNDLPAAYELVFVGNMSFLPNVDCVTYVANEILPLIHLKNPEVRFLIAGADPCPAVKALASDRVKVWGWMDDIRDAYRQSQLFVGPLRLGTGLQNKLMEAMSMELPVVSSQLAKDAFVNQDECPVLCGDSPEACADLVLDLLADPEKRKTLGKEGRAYVQKHYSWDAVGRILENQLSGEI